MKATAPSAEHVDDLSAKEEPEIKRSSSVGASSKKLPGGGMGFGNLILADILAEITLKKVHHDDKREEKEKSSVPHAEPSKSSSTVKTKAPVAVRNIVPKLLHFLLHLCLAYHRIIHSHG